MVILVVFKVFLVVKNLEILIQIAPDSPIYYYLLRPNQIETTSNFGPSKLYRKRSSNRRGNFSIFSFRFVDVISTANQRRFKVLCPLGTELFIVYLVVIRLELFESQRPENPVKTALESYEKVTVNQPVTRGTGYLRDAYFSKVLVSF